MTKRIKFALEDAEQPVVPSFRIDGAGDVTISLTKGASFVQLGYLCSDTGRLVLYSMSTDQAIRFGLERDSQGKLACGT